MPDFDVVESPGRSGMRVLVTVASKYGATDEIAEAIGEVFSPTSCRPPRPVGIGCSPASW
jgi:hypothetical protein